MSVLSPHNATYRVLSSFYYCHNYEMKLQNEIKCATTFEMLDVVFGKATRRRTQVHLWYNRFKEIREDANDVARLVRPSTLTIDENIEAVKQLILDNRRITNYATEQIIHHVVDKFQSTVPVKQTKRKICRKR